MERNTIEVRVYAILVDKLGVDIDEVCEDCNLQDDLGMDSLDCVEIIMEIEKEFNLIISDEEADSIMYVKDIINCLNKRLN